MKNKSYFSSAIVTFPSEIDYKMWAEKIAIFNSDKAKEFLVQSGQLSFSCVRITDENIIRVMILWEYRDEEAFKKCQKLWSKWGDIANNFTSKIVFNRGKKFYGW
ncbi:MAG: DUF6974 family protein [Candidatus Puniceispirillales bacterium]|jgi:hypothetical protein|tara:strand:+ start:102 stop:416 length:315 start_codon:yes stop_codon:yes gene_type:complete